MEGEGAFATAHQCVTYLACGAKHQSDIGADPERYVGSGESTRSALVGWPALKRWSTWNRIAATALDDVRMLRTELLVGYLVAGFAAALIPPGALSSVLRAVGAVPIIGYVLLLVAGLLIAIATFVCSMGNVPVARYLAVAGIPLGANTTFIYGDLLILPLIAIYRKSFPARVTWTFLGLFAIAAMIAGAVMDIAIGNGVTNATGSMQLNDLFTAVSNGTAIVTIFLVAVAARRGRSDTATLS